MILTLMLLILAATLVIVIIGFVMDRMAITKIKSGMRTINKRMKRIEKEIYPEPTVVPGCEGFYVESKGVMHDWAIREADDDSKTDSEIQAETDGDIPAETDGEVQHTGD